MTIQSLLQYIGLPGRASHEPAVVPAILLREYAENCIRAGAPLVFMYATDERETIGIFAVHAVFSVSGDGFVTLRAELPGDNPVYPSLTTSIMAAHWFERLMHDQFGIVAEGHPDWRRLMHHENVPENMYPLRKDFKWNTKMLHAQVPYPMHAVEGEGIYEIPVGPIHAGIIEPGHFRFNVRGERILTLEGKLFFKHKGVEKLLERKTPKEALPFIERISGDMVVGHTLAYAQAIERVCGTHIPDRARYLRVIWNELERATAHIFDIGNMGGNGTGFTFMVAQGFRMVEEMRRLHATLVGHRFLRGAITLGGAHDIDEKDTAVLLETIARIEKDIAKVLKVAFASDGLMERFETTGVLSRDAAMAYGARGLPARASGVESDLRHDHPYAAYTNIETNVMTDKWGDVAARFRMRAHELEESFRLIREALAQMSQGTAEVTVSVRAGEALGWNESWRGGVIDWVRIDENGKIERCAISDPSFCNWPLFGEIGPGNIVPDFPLCNKSLNLSYSGTDL